MRIPKKDTADYAVVKRLHAATHIECAELRDQITASGFTRKSVHSAFTRLLSDNRVLMELHDGAAAYQLSRQMRNYMDGCDPHEGIDRPPIVQPAVVNLLKCGEMKGYEAAMRRNIRPDGVTGEAHFVTSGTAPEPGFVGRAAQ